MPWLIRLSLLILGFATGLVLHQAGLMSQRAVVELRIVPADNSRVAAGDSSDREMCRVESSESLFAALQH